MRTAVLLALLLVPIAARAADPSALWNIVNGRCAPREAADEDPAPCAFVDLAKGYAVLKDIRGVAQFLLIPTARIGGIEDPAILEPDATNYWDAAWNARSFLEARLRKVLPRDAISLAINSVAGRTQNQLHIHIDCVSQEVRNILNANLDKISDTWAPFPIPLAGHRYRAIRIDHDTLAGVDPFHLLADADPQARNAMGDQTLVLIGATFADAGDGFVLLDDHVDKLALDFASGEELQDHACAVATHS
jgi:CDP-diacylglycerol pyrophosphatase